MRGATIIGSFTFIWVAPLLVFICFVASEPVYSDNTSQPDVYLSLARYFYYVKKMPSVAKEYVKEAIRNFPEDEEAIEFALKFFTPAEVMEILAVKEIPKPSLKNPIYLGWWWNAKLAYERRDWKALKVCVEKLEKFREDDPVIVFYKRYLRVIDAIKKVKSRKKESKSFSLNAYYLQMLNSLKKNPKHDYFGAQKWFSKGVYWLNSGKLELARLCFEIASLLGKDARSYLEYIASVYKKLEERRKVRKKTNEVKVKIYKERKSTSEVKVASTKSTTEVVYFNVKPFKVEKKVVFDEKFVTVEVKSKDVFLLRKVEIKEEDRKQLLAEYRKLYIEALEKDKRGEATYDDFINAWLKFIRVYPDDVRANYELLMLYILKGDVVNSVEYFKRLLWILSDSKAKESLWYDKAKKLCDWLLYLLLKRAKRLNLVEELQQGLDRKIVKLEVLGKKIVWEFSSYPPQEVRVPDWWRDVKVILR